MSDLHEVKELIADAQKSAESARAEHVEALKDVNARVKALGDENVEQKQAFQDATEKLVRIEEDVQKASDRLARLTANGGAENQKSIKEILDAKADVMKGYAGGNMNLLEAKDITSSTAGSLVQAERVGAPVMAPEARLWLRDIMTVVPTSSNAVEWVQETSRTNNAAIQAVEGDTKAQSDIDFELKTSAVKTIAHFTRQSRQIMQDVPQLAGIVENMLRYGLNSAEEVQLLNGAGTGSNMLGILAQASAYDPSVGGEIATDTRIDRLRRAMALAEDDLYPASAIVMNHKDWAEIEMQKTDDKAYLFSNPVNSTAPRLWGLPVVSAPSMAAGSFLLGSFANGAILYDREETTVRVADMDGSDFVQNMIKVLVEKRCMVAVTRPSSFFTGDFAGL